MAVSDAIVADMGHSDSAHSLPDADKIEVLMSYASSYGLSLTPEQAKLLIQHILLVIEKNKQLNLTRITSMESALVLHALDSLLVVNIYDASRVLTCCSAEQERFLDIGTGAGFPGIPFGIVTGMNGLLLDSVNKKVMAVREFIGELGLTSQLTTSSLRAEALAKTEGQSFSLVMARAVASMNVLVEYASPLLQQHGLLICSKARISDDEVQHALHTARLCGMKLVSRETFDLPHDLGHRELFTFEKSSYPRLHLPRAIGMAKNKPL
ncbi:16S rRNA (guanine(527)-N(7))-methyltransferase RsmG [Olsenella massiliensis]|uniref:16S rRNA (guanine(527)-N(7))-methyltransferase RsmG n=1 Tax=Olsenella massiliensis TaxID=1622075 RepID=UPI000A7D50B1|nr:16S rRNA (guanine(527)-N(7))-methyltransferase RsmG [Olsenella massiliensis]